MRGGGSRGVHPSRCRRRVPAHCTSLGKVLLAFHPDAEGLDFLPDLPLDPYTPMTIVDRERLARELADVRARGYALDIEEFHPGNACVGAPVWSHGGRVVAAISLMLSVDDRIRNRDCAEEASAVVATANEISRQQTRSRAISATRRRRAKRASAVAASTRIG